LPCPTTSLLKAAEQVALTQPGASKALQEIESTLGAQLFTRTNRGLEATELGHCVIRYARLIQTDLTHLREEMLSIMQGHGGRLAVGTIMGAVPLLTDALTQLLEDHPTLSVEIVEDTSARLLRLLDQGRLDLAICRTSISQRPTCMTPSTSTRKQLAVVASVQHPLAGASPAAGGPGRFTLGGLFGQHADAPDAGARIPQCRPALPAAPDGNHLGLHHACRCCRRIRTSWRCCQWTWRSSARASA
jgi:DNA-binding transcriptional LysR family regulator